MNFLKYIFQLKSLNKQGEKASTSVSYIWYHLEGLFICNIFGEWVDNYSGFIRSIHAKLD